MHPYQLPAYVDALTGTGNNHHVEILDGPIWVRPIPETPLYDAVGMYPFSPLPRHTTCGELTSSLRDLGLVSLVLVTDALEEKHDWFEATFQVIRPYKTHFIVSQSDAPVRFSKHHRQEIKKAKRACQTGVIALENYIDEWCELYNNLIKRHNLSELHCFSREYFEEIAQDPHFSTVGAFVEERLVSAHIWLRHGDHIYSHLGASSVQGYATGASYAVYDYSISYFDDCTHMDLGGVADESNSSTGLSFFKRGFANQTRSNWVCGSIADQRLYNNLCLKAGINPAKTSFFPAYRAPGSAIANPAPKSPGL